MDSNITTEILPFPCLIGGIFGESTKSREQEIRFVEMEKWACNANDE